MRRRLLLGDEGGVLTISPTASTVACSASTLNVTLYWNGAVLKADGVTYDYDTNEGVSSVSFNKNTGIATITYTANKSLDNPRQMTVTFTYKRQDASILITQQANSLTIGDEPKYLFESSGATLLHAVTYSDGTTYVGNDITATASDNWMTCSYDTSNSGITIQISANNTSSNRMGTISVASTSYGNIGNIEMYQYKTGYEESLPQIEGVRAVKAEDQNVYWATKNVGASTVYGSGKKYQWGAGATENECHVKQYDDTIWVGTVPSSSDTATQVLGSKWRTPSLQEYRMTFSNYDFAWYYSGSNIHSYFRQRGIVYFNDDTKDLLFLPYVPGRSNDPTAPCQYEQDCNYWINESYSKDSAKYFFMRTDWYENVYKMYGMSIRGVFPIIKLSSSAATVDTFSGETTFEVQFDGVTYDGNITLSSNKNWVTPTNNNGTITLTYQQNSDGDERVATITVTALSQTATFTLTQEYVEIITSLPYDGIYNGHKYITQLRSSAAGTNNGINWAINDVGAPSDGRLGNIYQWGAGASTATLPYPDYYYSGTTVLPASADTATQVMGGAWRMPRYKLDFDDTIVSMTGKKAYYYDGNEYISGYKVSFPQQSGKFIFMSDGCTEKGIQDCGKRVVENGYYRPSMDYWLGSCSATSSAYQSQRADALEVYTIQNSYITAFPRDCKYLLTVRGVVPFLDVRPTYIDLPYDLFQTTFEVILDNVKYTGNVELTASSSIMIQSMTNNNGTVTVNLVEKTGGHGGSCSIYVKNPITQQSASTFIHQSSIEVITSLPYDGVANGMKYIEIAGTKWAVNNIGATSDGDVGEYYEWGSGNQPYEYGNSHKYSGSISSGFNLPSTADTATQVLGSNWRTATYAEWTNLTSNTYASTVLYKNGNVEILGKKIYKKGNKSLFIFVPYAGYKNSTTPSLVGQYLTLWTSTASSTVYAHALMRYGNGQSGTGDDAYIYGLYTSWIGYGGSIRAVYIG